MWGFGVVGRLARLVGLGVAGFGNSQNRRRLLIGQHPKPLESWQYHPGYHMPPANKTTRRLLHRLYIRYRMSLPSHQPRVHTQS